MSKFKKMSFIIVFALALFAGLFGVINPINTVSLEAASTSVSLTVKKVKYSDNNISKDEEGQNIPKHLGEYTEEELYNKKDSILNSTEDDNLISSGNVASINPDNYEAVLVYLSPSQNTTFIKMLSTSLTIYTKNDKKSFLLDSYNVISGSQNFVLIKAFDFSTIQTTLSNVEYSESAHIDLTFNYSYTTNGTNIISDSTSFDFYLIDETIYFGKNGENSPKIENCLQNGNETDVYFYNKSNANYPTITFDPYKFSPIINYTYNETSVTLKIESMEENNVTKFKLVSSDNNIYESKILTLNESKLKLELNRIGKYEIKYLICIGENKNLTILDEEKSSNVKSLKTPLLYNFGYEALYKNYQETNNDIKRLNQDYKCLYNDLYQSDFSYIEDFYEKIDDKNVATINNVISYLNNNANFLDKVAVTNQAPIKINSYVTENLSGAKYYLISKNSSTNEYEFGSSESDFTTSKRFEKEGLYVVIIPYKFQTYKDDTFYKVLIFKIENSTPQLNFYNDEQFSTLVNANGFTNQDVYCVWNKDQTNPFVLPSKIKVTRNGTILQENKDYSIKSNNSQNYIYFDKKTNGEYLVQLTYGTSEVTIEKRFVIDTTEILFDVVSVEKKENRFALSSISLNENKASTDKNFAVFVQDKKIKSNLISVTYDYISLNYQKADKLYDFDDKDLLIYNNYQLNSIRKNLTYSNNTLNNLSNLSNLQIKDDNTNAIISINALYKFTITDLAGNKQTFFVLFDNSPSIALESNSLVSALAESKKLVDVSNNEAILNEKDNSLNLISDNYSVIFGDYKVLEFKIDDNNLSFAKEYFNDTNLTTGTTYLKSKLDKIKIERKIFSKHSENEIKTIECEVEHNIFSIDLSKNTENKEFDCIYTISLKDVSKKFNLNTDRNQILIFGKKDNITSRVYKTHPTNSENVYITFKNKINNDGFDLESLILDFYPFVETDNQIKFSSISEQYNLLELKESGNMVFENNAYGDYIVKSIVLTYKDGKYVSKEGKYVITKTYKNKTSITQTFYVDRHSPISYFESLQSTLIGKNINITLDAKELSADKIYKLILNNIPLSTNMLNFAWKNSEKQNFVYKYESLNNEDKDNLKINFALFKTDEKEYERITNFSLSSGEYSLLIFDNTFFDFDNYNLAGKDKYDQIKKYANYVELKIKTNKNTPSGYFVKDENEKLDNVKSTNSSTLSFEFTDPEDEFLYAIDLNNIILKQNGNVIFRTTKENDIQKTGSFTLENGKTIYYISSIGNVFNFKSTEIGLSRFKYILTILDPSKNSDVLFENGKSLEAKYNLILSYNIDSKYQNNYSTCDYEMIIDHTSPNTNFIKYLQQDNFLLDTEKEQLKLSLVNKDISNDINFDNYVFVVNSAPTKSDETDTANIYIRKYEKFAGQNIENMQSLVLGDARFSDQTISRYRFDINTYTTDGKKLYSTKEYNSITETFFDQGEGYYEIIEADEAGNYSVYTVYYTESQGLLAKYSVSGSNEEQTTTSSETNLIDPQFKLTAISTNNDFNFLTVKVLINENGNNSEEFNLRYLPFAVNDSKFDYFTQCNLLVERINSIMKNFAQINEYGNVCKITISNQFGKTLTITNSTPNKEFEIKDFIKNYDNNKIVLTIPNSSENATYIKSLSVYPVIDGKKGERLKKDSNKAEIPDELFNSQNYVFTFNDTCYVLDDENNEQIRNAIKVYYFVWEDNFGRIQSAVRYLGEKSESKFIFENGAGFVTKNGENYTQYSEGIKFQYNPELYNIEFEYQLLPNTYKNKKEITEKTTELDLFSLVGDDYINSQIKFIVTLTDLTKLDEELQSQTVYSYIYYPYMPQIEFTDSSGNSLRIFANEKDNIISTSKNVHLSFINNTLFNLQYISVTRTYTISGKEQKQEFNITTTDYTFSDLGNYEIVAINELGKKNTYKFNITTATNKTYTVETNEENITNFELVSCSVKSIEFTESTNPQSFEVYYSIYEAKVIVNHDFNLDLKTLTPTDAFKDYKLYQILKGTDTFKYIAIKKIDYNSNFLNISLNNTENESNLSITDASDNSEIAIKGYTVTGLNGIVLKLPIINSDESNKIVLKLFYNNKLLELNENIYSIDSENQEQIITLDDVPSGIYSLYIEDLAGNIQLFSGNTFLNLAIYKEVPIQLNNEIPVDYQIFNSDVSLTILNEKQYVTGANGLKVEAWLNNNEIKSIKKDDNKNYIFSDYGFYKVTVSGRLTTNGPEIKKTIFFTILNSNEAIKEFSFVSLNGQNITKVMKDGKDATTLIKRILALFPIYTQEDGTYNQSSLEQLKVLLESDFEKTYLYNLTLKSEIEYTNSISKDDEGNDIVTLAKYLAGGEYEVFVSSQNLILGQQNYSFKVWIRDKDAKIKINSTLAEGGETSKEITLSYNPYLIFTQIGECKIYVNNNVIAEINNSSINDVSTFVIPKDAKGTYVVQVKSSSGNTELSFVLNKKEPLSAVSIIVIVIAVLVVAGGIFLFVKLRTKMKVK